MREHRASFEPAAQCVESWGTSVSFSPQRIRIDEFMARPGERWAICRRGQWRHEGTPKQADKQFARWLRAHELRKVQQ